MENLSERLKYLLDKKKITAYYLSEKTGISAATFSRLLSGKSEKMSIKTSDILVDYFNVNEDWLLRGDGKIYDNENSIRQSIKGDSNIQIGKGKGNINIHDGIHRNTKEEINLNKIIAEKDKLISLLLEEQKRLHAQIEKLINKIK